MTTLHLLCIGAILFACGFVWGRRSAWLRGLWCDLTHGGGGIQRDSLGRINWQCRKCGRWSPNPVPLHDERAMTDQHISNSYKFDEDTHS